MKPRTHFAAFGLMLLASTAMAQMNGAMPPAVPAAAPAVAPQAAPAALPPAAPGTVPVAAPMPSTAMPVMPVMPVVPGATALPEVSVPSVPVAPVTGATPVAPAKQEKPPEPELPTIEEEPAGEAVDTSPAPDPTPMEDPAGADYSYGTANYSLLFTRNQINKMKSVLSIFEERRKRGETTINVVENPDEFADIVPAAVPEPALYPVYTLKSIVFRNRADWTVWIGDLRITPRKNDQEVRVIAAGPGVAQFIWKPAYSQALQQRAAGPGFAKTDAVSHKETRPNTAVFDKENGQVSFTLRPNQTFAPAYMATFEGKIASPALPQMDDDQSIAEMPEEPGVPKVDTSAANPVNLDALLKAQQQSPLGALVRGQPNRNQQPAAPQAAPVPPATR